LELIWISGDILCAWGRQILEGNFTSDNLALVWAGRYAMRQKKVAVCPPQKVATFALFLSLALIS